MLDITATDLKLTTGSADQAKAAQRTVADAGGETPPADGTILPSNRLTSTEVPKLPELKRLSEGLAEFARSMNRDLHFRVDESSGRTVVTVIDGETKEVIRQVPGEEMLRMAEALESAGALLFDAQA